MSRLRVPANLAVSRLRVPANSVCVCVLARNCEVEEVRIALIPLHVGRHRNAVDGGDCFKFESDLCLSCFDECHGIRIVDRLGEDGAPGAYA